MIRSMYKDLSKIHFRPELMFPFKLHEAVWRQQLISFDELTVTSTKQLILDLDEKQKTKQQNGKQQMCHFPPCEGYMHVVWYQTAVIGSQPLTEVSHTVSHGPA